MAHRALYWLVPLVILGFGCSHIKRAVDPTYTKATCTERDKCTVTVMVTACSSTGVTANPEELHVARGLKDVPITWRLEAPTGFTFTEDGISFKNMELARRQFLTPTRGATEFKWVDRNNEPGSHKYDIKVRRDGKDCPVYDPVIVNDP